TGMTRITCAFWWDGCGTSWGIRRWSRVICSPNRVWGCGLGGLEGRRALPLPSPPLGLWPKGGAHCLNCQNATQPLFTPSLSRSEGEGWGGAALDHPHHPTKKKAVHASHGRPSKIPNTLTPSERQLSLRRQ